MARRIPLSEVQAAERKPKRAVTGAETVVSLSPPERTFEIPVLDEEPVPPAALAWTSAPTPPTAPTDPSQGSKPLPAWRRRCWAAFPYLVAVFLVCVVVQVYLAGAAVFGGAVGFAKHKMFIHLFEFFPILMALSAFLGNRKSAGWWSIGLMVAIEVQYALAGIRDLANPSRRLLLLASLHVVNALFIFGTALLLVRRYAFWRRATFA